MPKDCANRNHKPLSFSSYFEGAHAFLQEMDMCKSFLQNKSKFTGVGQYRLDWDRMGLDNCLYLNASTCQHGEHAGCTNGETAIPTCQSLVSTYAHVRGQPLCASLKRCNRKGREKEGKLFSHCPKSASYSWKVTGNSTPASQTAWNSNGNKAGRFAS